MLRRLSPQFFPVSLRRTGGIEPRFLKENLLNSSTQAVKGKQNQTGPLHEYRRRMLSPPARTRSDWDRSRTNKYNRLVENKVRSFDTSTAATSRRYPPTSAR